MRDDDDAATEAELAHTRERVRAHQRRAWLAKAAGVSLTLVGLVSGIAIGSMLHVRGAFWLGLFVGGGLGSWAWRQLEPTESIDDL